MSAAFFVTILQTDDHEYLPNPNSCEPELSGYNNSVDGVSYGFHDQVKTEMGKAHKSELRSLGFQK